MDLVRTRRSVSAQPSEGEVTMKKVAIYGRRNFSGSSRVTVITRRVKRTHTPLKRMWIADKLAKINNINSDANVVAVAATG